MPSRKRLKLFLLEPVCQSINTSITIYRLTPWDKFWPLNVSVNALALVFTTQGRRPQAFLTGLLIALMHFQLTTGNWSIQRIALLCLFWPFLMVLHSQSWWKRFSCKKKMWKYIEYCLRFQTLIKMLLSFHFVLNSSFMCWDKGTWYKLWSVKCFSCLLGTTTGNTWVCLVTLYCYDNIFFTKCLKASAMKGIKLAVNLEEFHAFVLNLRVWA